MEALRAWQRRPFVSLASIAVLGIAIGAVTAAFTVLSTLVLDPLPFHEPEQLVRLSCHPAADASVTHEASHLELEDWARHADGLEGLAAFASSSGSALVELRGALRRIPSHLVTWNLSHVLGVAPIAGRPLAPEDDRPGAAPVVLVSERLADAYLTEGPVIGRRLMVSGKPHTIVGIMPRSFDYPPGAQVWRPVAGVVPPALLQARQTRFLNPVARLAAGRSSAAAGEELSRLVEQVTNPKVTESARITVTLGPLAGDLLAVGRVPATMLGAAALLIMLLVVVNLASLQVVRLVARRGEMAMRRALGARGWHVLRLGLTEGAVLGLSGALVGALTGVWFLKLASPFLPGDLFRLADLSLDWRGLAAAVACGLVLALAFGLAPWLTSRADRALGRDLAGHRTLGSKRARSVLAIGVVAQVGLTSVVCWLSVLLLESYQRTATVDTGFDRRQVLTFALASRTPSPTDVSDAHDQLARVVDRLKTVPEVAMAAGVLLRPLQGPQGYDSAFTARGQTEAQQRANPMLNLQAVTPGYFGAVGLPRLAGRDFDDRDDASSAAVVAVSKGLAERLWPERDPLGQQIKLGGAESPGPWMDVVAVVEDARYRGLKVARHEIYRPFRQSAWPLQHVVVRAKDDDGSLLSPVRNALTLVDPALQATDVASIDQLVGRGLTRARLVTGVFAAFAVLALVMSVLALASGIGLRWQLARAEVGLRLALGARPGQVAGMVWWQSARLVVLGGLAGLALAALTLGALRGMLEQELFATAWTDPYALIAVVLLIAAAGIAGAVVPARRVLAVEPSIALDKQ